jgi:hypothetical protein
VLASSDIAQTGDDSIRRTSEPEKERGHMNTQQTIANWPAAEGRGHELEVCTPDTAWNAVGGICIVAYSDAKSWWAVYAMPALASGFMLSRFPIRWKGTPS